MHQDQMLQIKEVQRQDQYGLAVYMTWKLSYDQLGSSAKSLLQLCSMLHHEGITEEIFERASLSLEQVDDLNLQIQVTKLLICLGKEDLTWNSLVFQQIIGEIRSYSLLEFDSQNQSYSMHPLVQHWSVSTLGGNKNDMQKCLLSIIGFSISWQYSSEDHKYRHNILQHITSCRGALQLEEIGLSVAENIALVYIEQGKWKEAEALEVVVIEKRKCLQGEEHLDTLTSMACLAFTYSEQGEWKEAEALETVVMEKRKHLLGEEHPDTLTSMAHLAFTYINQAKWKEAEALQTVVMENMKHYLGEQHPDTLKSMAHLASTYSEQGKWKEAEALQTVVMENMKHYLGEQHPDTLKSMAHLASTYSEQGKWKEAEALQTVVMEKMKHLLGEHHLGTLKSMANLASTYSNQGNWKEAEALQMVVIEKRKHLLGEQHPDTLISMGNLASTYRDQGKWKEAEALETVVVNSDGQG
jgi:tetratricopeptide (TPR) repeat protein